jgi:Fe-S-cluster containining protein
LSATQRQGVIRPLVGRRFRFSCHKDIPCFTQCCADLHMILTPYDIIRMKNRLQLSAEALIKRYTQPDASEGPIFPMLKLRMEGGRSGRCPFVGEQGCAIYEDRPGACRLYPLGRATSLGAMDCEDRECHFIVEESHCLGFGEEKEWTVEKWIEDQGFEVYNEMNRSWTEIVTSQNPRKRRIDHEKIQMFYMVSYNLDRFRDFVFQTKFLKVFRLTPEEIERISTLDVELMKLGMRWLKFALYGEKTLDCSPSELT